MILNQSEDAFREAVEATAQSLNLRPVFVEKDYWIVYVLKKLSKSEFADKVVFKGGTSLSKAYQCIQRFSEDIDLAILSPANNGEDDKAFPFQFPAIVSLSLSSSNAFFKIPKSAVFIKSSLRSGC